MIKWLCVCWQGMEWWGGESNIPLRTCPTFAGERGPGAVLLMTHSEGMRRSLTSPPSARTSLSYSRLTSLILASANHHFWCHLLSSLLEFHHLQPLSFLHPKFSGSGRPQPPVVFLIVSQLTQRTVSQKCCQGEACAALPVALNPRAPFPGLSPDDELNKY